MDLQQQINTPEIKTNTPERQVLPDVDMSFLQVNAPEFQLPNKSEKETKEKQAEGRAVLADISDSKSSQSVVKPAINQDEPRSGGKYATPAVARDTDRIEYEWVDVVRQVVASTTDNPHQREEDIKDIQEDYLFKRYGRKMGDSDNKTEIGL